MVKHPLDDIDSATICEWEDHAIPDGVDISLNQIRFFAILG